MIFRAPFPPHPGSSLRLPEVTLSALSFRCCSAIWVTEEVAAWEIPRRERLSAPFLPSPVETEPLPAVCVCVCACSPVPAGRNAAGLRGNGAGSGSARRSAQSPEGKAGGGGKGLFPRPPRQPPFPFRQ